MAVLWLILALFAAGVRGAEAQTRDLEEEPVSRLLPPEEVRAQGHPKLVALLVGEDYASRPGVSWGEGIRPLPGVWQDLARMQRRLEALGFGKVVVLAGSQAAGSEKMVSLEGLPGVPEEPAGTVRLRFTFEMGGGEVDAFFGRLEAYSARRFLPLSPNRVF